MATPIVGFNQNVLIGGSNDGIIDTNVDLSATAVDASDRSTAGYTKTIPGLKKRTVTATMISPSGAANAVYAAWATGSAVKIACAGGAAASGGSGSFTVTNISESQPLDDKCTIDATFEYKG